MQKEDYMTGKVHVVLFLSYPCRKYSISITSVQMDLSTSELKRGLHRNIDIYIMECMQDLLKELAESNKVLVAGSYSRGGQTETSDLDFQIKTPRSCVIYGGVNDNVLFVIELLEKYKISWNSSRTGYISTIGEDNNLPIEIEFYDDFHHNRYRLKEIEIMGVKFKTH